MFSTLPLFAILSQSKNVAYTAEQMARGRLVQYSGEHLGRQDFRLSTGWSFTGAEIYKENCQ